MEDPGEEEVTLAFGKKPKKLDENNVAYLVALETQLAVNEGSLAEDEDEQDPVGLGLKSAGFHCEISAPAFLRAPMWPRSSSTISPNSGV